MRQVLRLNAEIHPQSDATVIATYAHPIDQDTAVPFSVNNSVLESSDASVHVGTGAKLKARCRGTDVDHRKLQLLKRSGLFGGDTRDAVIERACSVADLRAAYRLVHDVYTSTGFILPEPTGIRLRIFETSAETATFVAKVDGRVIGVLSLVPDSPDLGLPSDSAFKPELDALRGVGLRLCELTNQVVAEGYRKSAVATELMRSAMAHGIKAGFHHTIAAVSPSHNGFYELMGFRRFGTERSYSDKVYDPVIAMAMDLTRYRITLCGLTPTEQFLRTFVVEENRYLAKIGEWNRRARDSFLNVDSLIQLFVLERNFLAECSEKELRAVQFRWGRKLFSTVHSHGRSEASAGGHPVVAATPAMTPEASDELTNGFTFLSKEIFVRSLTTSRSRSFHSART
jgi:ribosomal protein S18 acetylase RimI-like enzyme